MQRTIYEAFFETAYKVSFFHLSTLETVLFQNYALFKGPTFETVFKSLRFHQTFRFFVAICILK